MRIALYKDKSLFLLINMFHVEQLTREVIMSKITTVRGSKGRRYEVKSRLYGTSNMVHCLYYGGVYLASTDHHGKMIDTIKAANEYADELGIEIINK